MHLGEDHVLGGSAGVAAAGPVAGPARDREWLVPAALMTAGLGLAALLLMPLAGYDRPPDYFGRFLNWMVYMVFGGSLLLAWLVVRMWRAGVDRPLLELKGQLLAARGWLASAIAGAMLAGIDMLFFMWIKPELATIFPFWADRLLADVDRLIFRVDPWRFFQGVDLAFHAWAYSFFWALAIMGTVVWLLAQPPSRQRSASLISYFALWSLFGTVGQVIFSSAGPIFYHRIGLGDRFADLAGNVPEVTQGVSAYLWNLYEGHTLGIGAGISAMPSLHIGTVVWIYLAFRAQRSRLAPLAALFALYMWLLSVALGWHYSVDGLVGAAGAWACQWGSAAWLNQRGRVAVAAPPAEKIRA